MTAVARAEGERVWTAVFILIMKVTALKTHPRNKAQVKLYLDGKFACNLAKIVGTRLRVGQELDEAALARLQKADDAEQAYERALRFLASRPRSEAEVRQRLRQHEVSEQTIDAVLERLRGAGLIDDQAFANYWVENRSTFRPKSKRMLTLELKRKGVKDAEALGQALENANDAEAAYQVAAKRARRMSALPYAEFFRKLGDFLARRGFDYETIQSVVKRVWSEMRAADEGATE
jgi:regulatory protein